MRANFTASVFGAALIGLSVGWAASASAQVRDYGGPDPAPGGGAYGGVQPSGFYEVERRIEAMDRRVDEAASAGRLSPRAARRARAELHAIRGEAAFRRQRHGGELRDWDRELLTNRLDAVGERLGG